MRLFKNTIQALMLMFWLLVKLSLVPPILCSVLAQEHNNRVPVTCRLLLRNRDEICFVIIQYIKLGFWNMKLSYLEQKKCLSILTVISYVTLTACYANRDNWFILVSDSMSLLKLTSVSLLCCFFCWGGGGAQMPPDRNKSETTLTQWVCSFVSNFWSHGDFFFFLLLGWFMSTFRKNGTKSII